MRNTVHKLLEVCRVVTGPYASSRASGLMGGFIVTGPDNDTLRILSSGSHADEDWEHVSVSIEHRTPNWKEMCWVKDLFWGDEECVVQVHPPKSEYVDIHKHCLHLWRPRNGLMMMPPSHLVGPKRKQHEAQTEKQAG